MNKMFKVIVAVMLLMFALATAGCGGDKFAGTWFSVRPNMVSKFSGDYYEQITIEENSDNSYIIKKVSSSYKKKDKLLSGSFFLGTALYDLTFKWTPGKLEQQTATLKDNKLIVDGTAGMLVYAYVEKNGTLMCSDGLVYAKEQADSMKKFKETEQKRLTDLKDQDKMSFYKKKNIKGFAFSD